MLGGADGADTALVHLTNFGPPEAASSIIQGRPL
jgi:hypothetical protein